MADRHDREFVAEHIRDDISKLALKLHNGGNRENGGLDVTWVLQQIAGYQAIEKKLPTWYNNPDILFPAALPLEQCSSEATALYKKDLMERILRKSKTGTDLTGGFGVDSWALSSLFETYHYVERNAALCQVTEHNFQVLASPQTDNSNIIDRHQIEVHIADAREYLNSMCAVEFIYMDPARRDVKGGKTVLLSDCEPDVTQMLDTLQTKTRFLLLKLSPMLDISLAMKALPGVMEVHIVAVDNDCKELLFLIDFQNRGNDTTVKIVTANIQGASQEQRFSFSQVQETAAECQLTDTMHRYLYEPNVAVLKGGAFKLAGAAFSLLKLHQNTHLYTSDHLVEAFPGKIFEIEKILKPSAKETKTILGQTAQANVCIRNYPDSVDTLRKRFHLKDGGDHYLYGVTVGRNEHLLILCRRIFPGRNNSLDY